MLEFSLLVSVLLFFVTQRIAAILDRRLAEGDVPPNGKLLFYILKNALLSVTIYRILIATNNYEKWQVQNANEAKVVRLIYYLHRLHIASTITALLIVFITIHIRH